MKYDYKDNYLSFDNVFSYLGSFPTKRRRGKHKSKTETTPQISTKRNRANTTKSSKSQSIICTLLKTKYMLNIFLFYNVNKSKIAEISQNECHYILHNLSALFSSFQ